MMYRQIVCHSNKSKTIINVLGVVRRREVYLRGDARTIETLENRKRNVQDNTRIKQNQKDGYTTITFSRTRNETGTTTVWWEGDHFGAGLALAGDLEGGGASRGRGPEGDP